MQSEIEDQKVESGTDAFEKQPKRRNSRRFNERFDEERQSKTGFDDRDQDLYLTWFKCVPLQTGVKLFTVVFIADILYMLF